MAVLKVPFQYAEGVKKALLSSNCFDFERALKRDSEFVYFPTLFAISLPNAELVELELKPVERPQKDLKRSLEFYLTPEELDLCQRSFDVIGSIAILEICDDLLAKEDIIATALLESHPQIKTVLKKIGMHEGEFRTQVMEFVAGVDTRETLYRESGVSILVDVEKVYFSPRTSNERLRIAKLVKGGEKILVMFSGCGPYPLVIAKNASPKHIVGIELNPVAHDYALKNIAHNKCFNVAALLGDVSTLVPPLGTFDRIIMPLPKNSEDFLAVALCASQPGTIIHFYTFCRENALQSKAEEIVEKIHALGGLVVVQQVVIAGHYAPHVEKICVDLVVLRPKN